MNENGRTRAVRAEGSPWPTPDAEHLHRVARAHGAADRGSVAVDDPAVAEDRPHIEAAFPAARRPLVPVGRVNRGPVRSPARSVSDLEFHRAGGGMDATARAIVRDLGDRGIHALNRLRFRNRGVSILRCLVTRQVRLSGPPRLLAAFGRCFPG